MLYYLNRQCPQNHYTYVIKAGDTFYKIAQANNVSVASILTANQGIDPNYLFIGQRINVNGDASQLSKESSWRKAFKCGF